MRLSMKNIIFPVLFFLQTLLVLYLLLTDNTPSDSVPTNSISYSTKLPCLCRNDKGKDPLTVHPPPPPPSLPSYVSSNVSNIKKNNDNLKKERLYLLVVIISTATAKGSEKRKVIRETWANKDYAKSLSNTATKNSNTASKNSNNNKVKVKFVIGTEGLTEEYMTRLYKEDKKYGDLILLNDLTESYHNLTLKVLQTFVYVNRNFDITYLFKGDEDTFVRLDILVKELMKRDLRIDLSQDRDLKGDLSQNRDLKSYLNSDLSQNRDHKDNFKRDLLSDDDLSHSDLTTSPSPSLPSHSYYWGFFNGRARVKRKGKWKESKWFLCNYYLPYALGGGYVLSGDLVGRIVVNAAGLQLYHSEDVSVGVWLSSFQIERRHDVRFNTLHVSRGCRNVYIVSHKQTMADMRSKHENLLRNGRQCNREFQRILSYEYNWSVPTSECCQLEEGIP